MASGERKHGRRDVDRILVELLAGGATISDAAKAAGVSVSTVRRRFDDLRFVVDVEEERTLIIHALRGRLLEASGGAVTTLAEVASDGRTDAARVSASRAILDLTVGPRREVIGVSEARELFGNILRSALDRLERLDPEEARALFAEVEAMFRVSPSAS
jgi:AcrR family transcriptional regulator